MILKRKGTEKIFLTQRRKGAKRTERILKRKDAKKG